MKTNNSNYKILFLGLALAIGAGCSSGSGSSVATAADPCATVGACVTAVSPTPTPTPVPGSGGTANVTLVSTAELDRLFYNSVPVSPTDVTLTFNPTSSANSVTLSYIDSSGLHQAPFGTINPTYSATSDASFNKWYTDQGATTQTWKGFFQDSQGAVIIIIDQFTNLGDGTTSDLVGGSIWFQNFGPAYAFQGPLAMCWQISLGPYDCRTWLVNNNVDPTSNHYPNNHGPNATMSYEKLGTFTGLSRSAAGI